MNSQIISQRIKELRESKNMTQKEFGDFINLAQTTLSSYENDSKTPNIDTLISIAKKCNVSLDWLCGLSDIQKTKNFTSYSDIFRLLINICKSIKIELREYHYSQDDFDMALIAKNTILIEFLNKWNKVKAIYDDGTLDDDTYEIVIKSLVDKYYTDTIDYDETLTSDFLDLDIKF